MSIHPVDLHVGERLRKRRQAITMSQSTVADAVGITFQQIQKYENGSNRISASMLFDLADVLGIEVGYFFHGAPARSRRGRTASQRGMRAQ